MLEQTISVLAEPTRFRIVEFLLAAPRSVSEICGFLGIDQPLISKHLRALRGSGLVDAHYKKRQRIYELRPEPFQELNEWTERFRNVWETRYRALDEVLAEMKAKSKGGMDGRDQG
jgi:DNA-binding transcriptional ArsR family regulator